MAESLCSRCVALCCRYFALPIDNPETRADYDHIRWYLCHENVVVFVEDKQWYIGLLNRCKHLQADNRCGIYETRPRICRSYSTNNCEYHGDEYDYEQLFTSADDLVRYAEQTLSKKYGRKVRLPLEPKPPKIKRRGGRVLALPLPVLSSNGTGGRKRG